LFLVVGLFSWFFWKWGEGLCFTSVHGAMLSCLGCRSECMQVHFDFLSFACLVNGWLFAVLFFV
jgi:hypothetical protein